MRFGLCIPNGRSAAAASGGWDFVEEVVTDFLQAELPDETWRGLERAREAALPIPAANRLLPATLKVVGPNVDCDALAFYMNTVARRAGAVGMKFLVFGSGPARSVPEGFDRARAREQILDFARMAAEQCAGQGVTLLAEPMNRRESNIINSISEAMQYVKAVDHPNFQCLLDTYHFWLEQEPLESLHAAMPWIRHVHVADVESRRAPGETGKNDYRPIFRALLAGGYEGLITVESNDLLSLPKGGSRVLRFLKDQMREAAALES